MARVQFEFQIGQELSGVGIDDRIDPEFMMCQAQINMVGLGAIVIKILKHDIEVGMDIWTKAFKFVKDDDFVDFAVKHDFIFDRVEDLGDVDIICTEPNGVNKVKMELSVVSNEKIARDSLGSSGSADPGLKHFVEVHIIELGVSEVVDKTGLSGTGGPNDKDFLLIDLHGGFVVEDEFVVKSFNTQHDVDADCIACQEQ